MNTENKSTKRYKELFYQGKTYTQEHKIDAIFVKNGYEWILDADIANARIEIDSEYFIWNGGIWYNGTWKMGVWRGGTWKFGKWMDGVFYNGEWEDGMFMEGIIGSRTYNTTPKFYSGQILNGEIQSGEMIDCDISPSVVILNNKVDKSKDF